MREPAWILRALGVRSGCWGSPHQHGLLGPKAQNYNKSVPLGDWTRATVAHSERRKVAQLPTGSASFCATCPRWFSALGSSAPRIGIETAPFMTLLRTSQPKERLCRLGADNEPQPEGRAARRGLPRVQVWGDRRGDALQCAQQSNQTEKAG